MTVRDLITLVLRQINVLGKGETADDDDAADGLIFLNDFIASVCQLERLMIYTTTRSTWTLVSGTATYTVGTGGTISIPRPIFIDSLGYIDTSVTPVQETSMGTPLTDAAWAAIPIKTQTATYPVYGYYNPTFASGFGTLSLWFVPTSSSLQGVIYVPTPVAQFSALSDTIALPPGYLRFLRTNLGVEFWSTWKENIPLDPVLAHQAAEAKANVKRANMHLQFMAVDPALTDRAASNIYTGP